MKHLKTLEAFTSLRHFVIKKGDYVVLNLDEIKKENDDNGFTYLPKFNVAKVLVANRNQGYPYLIQFIDNDKMSVKGTEILRLANLEEIEEYELKEKGNKYNL
jgi:hypothetical protein